MPTPPPALRPAASDTRTLPNHSFSQQPKHPSQLRGTLFSAHGFFSKREFFPMEREGAFSFCGAPRPLVLSPPPPPASPSPNQWFLHTLNHLHGVSLPGSTVDHDQLFFLPNWTNLTGELREERERGWFSRMAGEEEGGGGGRGVKSRQKAVNPVV